MPDLKLSFPLMTGPYFNIGDALMQAVLCHPVDIYLLFSMQFPYTIVQNRDIFSIYTDPA